MKTITIEIDAAQIADLGILKGILSRDPEITEIDDKRNYKFTRQSKRDGERQIAFIQKIEEAYAKR